MEKEIKDLSLHTQAVIKDKLDNQLKEIEQNVNIFKKDKNTISPVDLLEKFQNYNCLKNQIKEEYNIDATKFLEQQQKYDKMFRDSPSEMVEDYFMT
jgi:hypothetical protein